MHPCLLCHNANILIKIQTSVPFEITPQLKIGSQLDCNSVSIQVFRFLIYKIIVMKTRGVNKALCMVPIGHNR